MPSFTDVAAALTLPSCCMRKNPTPKEQLKDDLKVLGVSFGLYLLSYWLGYHSLCMLSMATMNLITFQVGVSFHEAYSKPIHLNQFDELDSSMEADNFDNVSLKQKEQGATSSCGLTEEQEAILNKKLQQVVEETGLRNRKRNDISTARTPSSNTLAEEGWTTSCAPIPYSYTEEEDRDEYKDLPALLSSDGFNVKWSEIPNFSQNHYLHNYMEELD
jgi:hypothetical protein